jgi:hypothetical protein
VAACAVAIFALSRLRARPAAPARPARGPIEALGVR